MHQILDPKVDIVRVTSIKLPTIGSSRRQQHHHDSSTSTLFPPPTTAPHHHNTKDKNMKIIIIGAGISGCAAYLTLRKHLPPPPPSSSPTQDHEYTIYEAYPTTIDTTSDDRPNDEHSTHSATLTIGGGLGVAPNGLRVLERLDEDILRDAVSGGYMVDHSNLKDKHGRVLMRLPSSSTTTTGSRDSDGTTTTPMHLLGTSRHNIWRCLRKRIPDSIIINKRVASVTAHPTHRNTVTFVDGSEPVHADLVIGADGLKSVTKHALFDGDPYPPHYEYAYHPYTMNIHTNNNTTKSEA